MPSITGVSRSRRAIIIIIIIIIVIIWRVPDEELALLTRVEELGLEDDVLQEGQVQQSQADVLQHLAGAELPSLGVVANPGTRRFKHLGKGRWTDNNNNGHLPHIHARTHAHTHTHK